MRGIFVKLAFVNAMLIYGVSALANQHCRYQPEMKSLKINWTGYKATEKIAVSGTFDETSVDFGDPKQEAKSSLMEFLKTANVKVVLSSVNSDNWSRDRNLKKAFFKVWDRNDRATGKLINLKQKDENSGTGALSLTVAGQTKDIPVKYQMDASGVVTLMGVMDVMDFNGAGAMSSLNKKCEDLHRGSDGVSKTWSTVDLKITGQVIKLCQRSGR